MARYRNTRNTRKTFTGKAALALAALFAVGMLSAVALGDVGALGGATTTTEATTATTETTATGTYTTPDAVTTDATTTATTEAATTTATTTAATTTAATTTAATTTAATNLPPVPYIVTFKSGVSADAQAASLAAAQATETSFIRPLRMHGVDLPGGTYQDSLATLQADPNVLRVERDATRAAEGTPSDTEYASQWSLPRIGWDQVFGSVSPSGSATVAVLDTGVDGSHPDLQANLVPGTSIVQPGGDGLTDPNGHGTAMAGIVAATTDNNVGVAGVGYAGVKVMPVTVLGADGTGSDSDVIEGLVYAVDHGANVVLMSFSNSTFSPSLQDAIDYAWDSGVVLVGAVGNDGTSTIAFPAGDAGVIGVSSTDVNDSLSSFSNYGEDTFLAAPGSSIETTAPGGGYTSISGTSAAAAGVAGAAALLRATSVGASNGVIVNRLAESADAVGTATQTGNGRLDLARAVADSSSTSIKPAGAAPVGGGGPFVGPYVAAAAFNKPNLYTDSAHTDEDYVFEVGDTVYAAANGTSSNHSYKFEVKNGGTSLQLSTCQPFSVSGNFDSYTTNSSADLTYFTYEYNGTTCSGNPTSKSSTFDVAKATAYTSSALTTSTTSYGAGATAFVVVNGMAQGVNDWTTTWVGTGISCANTAGGDRPDSDGSGRLPNTTGSYLAYPPSSGDAWNVLTNYETRSACNAFSSANDGQWQVTLQKDATHHVTLNVFTTASAQATSTTASNATATYGDTSVSLSASVTSTSTVNSGSVTFTVKNGSTVIGSATSASVSNGSASVNYTLPAGTAAGTYTIVAAYSGAAGFNASSDSTKTLTINKATPTITWSNPADITYGTALSSTQLSATASVAGSFSYSPASGTVLNAGSNQTLSTTFTPTDTTNYTNATKSVSINVLKGTPTITWSNPADITYGTALSSTQLNATASVPGSFVYSPASGTVLNAGASQTLSTTFTPTDTTNSNNATKSVSINVNKAQATLTIDAGSLNQTYNGTAWTVTVTTSPSGLSGVSVTYAGSSTAPTNAGSYAVVASLTNANYTAPNATGTLVIAPKSVAGSFTAADKVYDGTTSATITGRSLTGAVAGDDVSLSGGTASFGSKTVGPSKTVTGSGFSLVGAAKDNYTLASSTLTTTASITAKSVSGSFTASDKVYDGTTSATISGRSLSGAISGDDVSLSGGTASFGDKNVGTAKTVTGSGFGLSGADASNYQLTSSVLTATANITAKPITGSFTANNKVYDGTTAATVATRSLNGAISGDNVNLSGGTASFGDKNVGTNKTVTLTGATLAGSDAGNYTLSSVGTATADITPKPITGSFTANDKVYDGTTAATVASRSLNGAIGGDAVSLTGGTASFADKNVGANKTVTLSGASLTGSDAGNYTLSSVANATADITAKPITGSFTATNKEYDGTTAATVASRSLNGVVGTDAVSLSGGTASFADKNVGTGKTVTLGGATLAGADAGNYSLSSVATATANITPKSITGSFTAADKVYDGTTAATITGRSLSGVIGADDVSLSGGSASFGSKTVGPSKTVTGSGFSLAGLDKDNYVLASTTLTTTASITPKSVSGSFTASSKVYDGTTAASISGRSLSGAISGDDVSLSGGTASFGDKNVGTAKTVTGSGFGLSGADASNYQLTSSVLTTTADITTKFITGSFTAQNKVYDGTTAATVASRSLSGAIAGDAVSLSGGTATFDTKNVGANKTVTLSGAALAGGDAGNYDLTAVDTAKADITAKPITGGFSAAGKVYDGTTAATVLSRSLNDTIAGDAVSLTGGTATFGNKNVGAGKTVTLTGATLDGADAGNYNLTSVATTIADITAKPITGNFTTQNKVYDGNTSATVTNRSLNDSISGDSISLTGGTATFDTKNVGANKTVTLSGATLSGTDAGNYTLTSVGTEQADITAKPITGSFTASNKVYDGNASATVTGRSLSGTVTGDNVSLDGGTASFADKNVGSGKTVTLSGASLSGGDAGNYTLSSVDTAKADITQKPITGNFTASSKVYDGTTAATVLSRTLNDTISGDTVSLTGGTATFASKTVGTAKTVTLTGATLAGGDAGNYNLTSVATTTADITTKFITGNFTAQNKVYDGTTAATILTRSLNDTISGDAVSLTGGTAAFDNKNVGTGKTVSFSGGGLTGADAGNYTLTVVGDAHADITAKTVTGSFTAQDKVYDGDTTATISGRSLSGVVGTEDVTLYGGTASFATKTVAPSKTVTGTGFTLAGADKGNYALASSTLTTTASITARPVDGSFTVANKVYDATTAASISGRALTNTVSGDIVSLSGGTASFVDKNVGTGKLVNGSGFALAGTDAANYQLNSSVLSTHADITAKDITGSFTASNKVYDGNTDAAVASRSLNGNIAGDLVYLSGGSATFDNKNVGTGKTVTLTGATLTGADAGNYNLTSVGTTTANITAKGITGNFTAQSKVYDGNASATVLSRMLNGVVGSDDVSLFGGTATFDTKNVGTGKTVTLTGAALDGAAAGNYSLSSVATTTADITTKFITGSFTAQNKVYSGTTAATILTRSLNDTISGDAVSLTGGTATFDNKNVGTGKTVSLAGATLAGTDAGNYTLTTVADTKADITAKTVTGSFTAQDKVYDGNNSATVTGRSLNGNVSGDNVSLTGGTATFANKNAGTGKTVTLTGASLSGGDAGNYTLASVNTTTASITQKPITGNFTVPASKTYDATTAAQVLTRTVNDTVGGDDISLSGGTAAYANKNVGTNKVVTLSGMTLGGADAPNYTLTSVATTTADITQKFITGSFTASNKVYDGTAVASIATRSLTGVISGDTVYLSGGTASFPDKNVGNGRTVTFSGGSLTGTDAGNYGLTTVANTTANITPLAITGNFTADNKVYDGNISAVVHSRSLNNTVAGDDVSLTGGTATFANKNAGTGKTVTLSGATLAGADAPNYSLTSVATTTADITQKSITGSFTAANKVYDGTTSATATNRTLNGTIAGDVVSLSGGTASFADKNVGIGKTVTLTGATLYGTDATNYNLTSVGTTTADITARPVTVTAGAKSKVYGDADPSLSYGVTSGSVVSGDSFSGSLTRDAGESVAGGPYAIRKGTLTLGSNYDLSYVGANLTITKAPLTVTADNKTSQYSDSVAYTASYSGFKFNETLASSDVTGSPALSSAATAASAPGTYTITAAAGTLASGNYQFSYVNGTLTVTKEDASMDYTGDTIGLTGSTGLTLRATVWDSAAAGSGFAGDSTIGDITKMFVQFDIFSGSSCGGTATATRTAQVTDSGTAGDGIGTASATFTSSSEATYCVVAKLIGSLTANSTNAYYLADPAEGGVVTFYDPTGQFVTGGGWITDPNGGKGNFGFNARFNSKGSPQGQMVYVYRGLYNGVLADYRIKSNSLTALAITCWDGTKQATCPATNTAFPANATLQGKSTIQINRASDGYQLYSDGNGTFNATVVDSGQSSGIGSDSYQLTVYDKNAVLYKPVPTSLLKGGNVVIHGSK